MKKLLLSSILLLFTFSIYAQNNELLIEWEKTYGGKNNDKANSIIQTEDGGYIVAGETRLNGKSEFDYDFDILKLDDNGVKIWEKTYGSSSNDVANSIIQTKDGGYAVVGYIYSEITTNYNSYLIKIDSAGNKVWDKIIGKNGNDIAKSIIQTKDGCYVIAGYTNSKGAHKYDFWVIKLDESGNEIWDKIYGGKKDDKANCIIQTINDEYVVSGSTYSKGAGDSDFWVIKIDKYGNIIWDKTFGGKKSEVANSVIINKDGGFVIAGFTKSKGVGGADFWVVRIGENGEKIWDKIFGSYRNDVAKSIVQTKNGEYIVVGYTYSNVIDYSNILIIRFDETGNKVDEKIFGGEKKDFANFIIKDEYGGSLVAGYTNSLGAGGSDLYIVKIKAEKHEIEKIAKIKTIPTERLESKTIEVPKIITKTINEKIKYYVGMKIKFWQRKGEFEKTEDYKKRINDNTRNKMAEVFAQEALFELKKEETRKYKKCDFMLSEYDADNETFLIKSKHGDIILPVQFDGAQVFKLNWNSVQVKNSDFILYRNSFVLSKLQFYNPVNNKSYTFDSKKSSTYDLGKIEYNFGEINYDSPVKKQDYVNNSKIVKTTTQVGKSDIDINIPATNFDNKNTFAVIIGNENYKNEQKVDYAINDAKSFNNYAIKTLNIPKSQVHFVKDATYGSLLSEFDWINQVSEAYKGKAKIIFYYAGHGMPDDYTKDAYLLPVDGYSTNTKSAVKLDDMFNSFTQYPAKSVTVFLDACFSGDARNGMLTAGRGVKIRPKNNILKGNLVVFSAVSGKETAHPYKEKQHGMFTYFLLKEIQAKKGDINYFELENYIKDNVYKKSVVLGNPQNPQTNVSDEVKDVWQDWRFNQ